MGSDMFIRDSRRRRRRQKKRLTLDDLMCAVLGRMRMSLADFEVLTVPELIMLYKAWGDEVAGEMRQRWEIMSVQVCALLQPWIDKKLDPYRFIPLPWDNRDNEDTCHTSRYSAETQKQRYDFYRKNGYWPEN